MKYNPKVNEWAAALPGFANLHPMQDEEQTRRGRWHCCTTCGCSSQEIAGLRRGLAPALRRAHGEWTALKVIRAYYKDHGQPKRRIVLAPDTAHGTNPASAARCAARASSRSSRGRMA